MCPLLKPHYFQEDQNIFTEGDSVEEIYFLISGKCNFVLPSFKNTPYISISFGSYFGEMDIVGSAQTMDFDMSDWFFNKQYISRQFSINAFENVELLILNTTHLH